MHHAFHQLHHLVGRQLAHGLRLLGAEALDDVAVLVFDAGDEHGFDVDTLVGESTHGTDHLDKLQVADTQADSWHRVNRRLYTHTAGLCDDGIRTELVHQVGRNPVVGLCEGIFQGDFFAHATARVARRPELAVLQLDVVLDVGYLGAWRVLAFLHGQGIEERLEGGAHLTPCLRDVVVLEETVVQAADISLHLARVRLDGDKAGLQEPLVVTDGIHRAHHRVDGAFPREDGHANGAVELGLDRVPAHAFVFQVAVAVGALHRSLQDMVDFVGSHIGEGCVLLALPVVVEHGLQLAAHEFFDGFLGIALHARVDGGIDTQSVAVDIVRRAVGAEGVLSPLGQLAAQELTEVGGLTAVVIHHAEVRHVDGNQRDGVALGLGDVAVVSHLLQHEVAAYQRTLGVAHRAKPCRRVDHTRHQGTFLDVEVFGRLVEEGFGRRADTKGIVTKSHGVEVHRHNLFLGIVVFQLGCRNPLLELAQHEFRSAQVLSTRKQVFSQLLRDGGAATFLASRQHAEGHANQGAFVDAGVFGETLVLDADQGFGHVV